MEIGTSPIVIIQEKDASGLGVSDSCGGDKVFCYSVGSVLVIEYKGFKDNANASPNR